MSAIIPQPRCPITIRPAAMSDYAFIDSLQAMHSKALGFMPRAQLEGKITRGEILIAVGSTPASPSSDRKEGDAGVDRTATEERLGYCMSADRYFKRDELGVIYQMNVAPSAQRKLVAASLLKAVFERSPYGCKLFCCWCAQDLAANSFWESMGFVPLAFRAGARGKRAHIFWQKRIREGDTTTPYWYPCKTDGGMMREDRLVLPIPPGVHWRDPMPILVPQAQQGLPAPVKKERTAKMSKARAQAKQPLSGLSFAPVKAIVEKPAKPKRQKVKADPAHVAKARELRDRYLEQFNDPINGGFVLGAGKYEVSRALASKVEPQIESKARDAKMLAA